MVDLVRDVVVDVEGDDLKATKLWCLSYCFVDNGESGTLTDYEDMREFLSGTDKNIIGHNWMCWDKPTLERILEIKIKHKVTDTLPVSWYLYPKRMKHGLEVWGEELGVAKPEISDWANLSLEEYCVRCEEDVKINALLWEKMVFDLTKLYRDESSWWKAVDYVTFKMHCLALQEKSKWKLDVPAAEDLIILWEGLIKDARDSLESVMPPVPVKKKKKRPKKPFKGDGTLSAHGIKWKELTDSQGLDFNTTDEVTFVDGSKPPNAGSVTQIKDWLYSLGWEPLNFDFKRDKETGDVRKIPQLKDDKGELCKNIIRIAEQYPQLNALVDLGILVHRTGLVSGFLECAEENGGYIIAGAQGFTNTLRLRHKVFLNVPSLRKPWGKEIRGLLIARGGYELMGSDMASLEDRTKQHYMWPHDPEYVKEMQSEDFDPHCDIAAEAGIMTSKEVAAYKHMSAKDLHEVTGKGGVVYVQKDLALKRHGGKGTNYAATYNAGAETIARTAGVPKKVGTTLHKAYWKRNWSLKAIAKECKTRKAHGYGWLWNPVAEIWYWLKNDNDRFSTLNQGTGSYCFDMWIKEVLTIRPQLSGQAHDEGIWEVKIGHREAAERLLRNAVAKVNGDLQLNRELDIDVLFSDSYAGIH